MAEEQDSGQRTHEATPRRLRDARRRGEVSRSREVAPTAALLVTTALVALYAGDAGAQFADLFRMSIELIGQPFAEAAQRLGKAAAWTLVSVTITVVIPVAVVAVLAEFLHVGPVFSSHPLSPDLSRLDPVQGLKRMLRMESWVELLKSLAKTGLLLAIAAGIAADLLPRLAGLHRGSPAAFGEAMRSSTLQLLAWTLAVFTVVAVLDALYQRHAFLKRMRMTRDEVDREQREDMGDPQIRQQRRALQREWAQNSEVAAARSAHLVVVNPTHVAVALDWHPEHVPVPVVAAKAEGRIARRMREAAEEEGVPVLRDVPLARALLDRADTGEVVPEDLFDAVAQAIVWAKSIRDRAAAENDGRMATPESAAAGSPAPTRTEPAPTEDAQEKSRRTASAPPPRPAMPPGHTPPDSKPPPGR